MPNAKPQVLPAKSNALERFSRRKPIIGVIHLAALPGAPRYDGQTMREIYASAEADARRFRKEGSMASSLKMRATCFLPTEHIGPSTVAALTARASLYGPIVPNPIGITCVAQRGDSRAHVAKAVGRDGCGQSMGQRLCGERGVPQRSRPLRQCAIDPTSAPATSRYRRRDSIGAHAITADRSIAEQATDAEWLTPTC